MVSFTEVAEMFGVQVVFRTKVVERLIHPSSFCPFLWSWRSRYSQPSVSFTTLAEMFTSIGLLDEEINVTMSLESLVSISFGHRSMLLPGRGAVVWLLFRLSVLE